MALARRAEEAEARVAQQAAQMAEKLAEMERREQRLAEAERRHAEREAKEAAREAGLAEEAATLAAEGRAKAEAARIEATKAEAARVEAGRVAAARVEAERLEAERVEAERIEAARVEAARVEAARVEAGRVEAARIEAASVEAKVGVEAPDEARLAKAKGAKVQAALIESLTAQAAQLASESDPARVKAGGVEAVKIEAARVEAATDMAARAAKLDATRKDARISALHGVAADLKAAESAQLVSVTEEGQKRDAAVAAARRVDAALAAAGKSEAARAEAARGEAMVEAQRIFWGEQAPTWSPPSALGTLFLGAPEAGTAMEERWAGTLDGGPVVLRRVRTHLLVDPTRSAALRIRAKDLLGTRHPFLSQVVEVLESDADLCLVEAARAGLSGDALATRSRTSPIPSTLFLSIATQLCNAVEALHGRPGAASGAEHLLHLDLHPAAIGVDLTEKAVVGDYGLLRSPTIVPMGSQLGSVAIPLRMAYLSPEQTHADQKLTPASDVFSLGVVLYELLLGERLFQAETTLQTIHKVRRAEVHEQLLRVKARLPGLDKVLFRALSLNPRHRYQRAFVMREDLRGLMPTLKSLPEDCLRWLRGESGVEEGDPDDDDEDKEPTVMVATPPPPRRTMPMPTVIAAPTTVARDDDEDGERTVLAPPIQRAGGSPPTRHDDGEDDEATLVSPPLPAAPPETQTAQRSTTDPSRLIIACPACKAKYQLPAEKLVKGRVKARCPSCASVFLVSPPPADVFHLAVAIGGGWVERRTFASTDFPATVGSGTSDRFHVARLGASALTVCATGNAISVRSAETVISLDLGSVMVIGGVWIRRDQAGANPPGRARASLEDAVLTATQAAGGWSIRCAPADGFHTTQVRTIHADPAGKFLFVCDNSRLGGASVHIAGTMNELLWTDHNLFTVAPHRLPWAEVRNVLIADEKHLSVSEQKVFCLPKYDLNAVARVIQHLAALLG